MELSEFVKDYRKRHKMSLRALASQCGNACTFQHLSNIEHGKVQKPSIETVKGLAKGMGMTVQELLEQIDDSTEVDFTSTHNKMHERLIEAYENSDERTKKAVCILLDIDEL